MLGKKAYACSHGTSPPARGKPVIKHSDGRVERNIPACTGKTHPLPNCVRRGAEHPRLHGENPERQKRRYARNGTSPPARGKRIYKAHYLKTPRNIPACTGKTRPTCTPRMRRSEHPRLHGENEIDAALLTPDGGTSPPARGKPSYPRPECRTSRNIPACTGKTPSSGCGRSVPAEHPRLHGENLNESVSKSGVVGTSPPARGKRYAVSSSN